MLQTQADSNPPEAESAPETPIAFGLSGKLLVLTVVFVMLAEVLIYVPSIANFRMTWLNDRLAAAHTAALVLDAAPSGMVPETLAKQILDSIGARAVAMKMGQQRRLLATSNLPSEVQQEVDVRDMGVWPAIEEAFRTLLFDKDNDIIRAIGPAPMGGEFVEIVIDGRPAAQGDVALFPQRAPDLAVDFRHLGGAGVLRAALHVRAAAPPHHREHDGVPRRSREPVADHRRQRPP